MYKVEVRTVDMPETNLRGFADVTINNMVTIRNVKIVMGKNGLFASMPTVKDRNGQFRSICDIEKDYRPSFNDAVLEAYNAELNQTPETEPDILPGPEQTM